MKIFWSLVFLLGLTGWILGAAHAFGPSKEVILVIPVAPPSYSHAQQLCSLTQQSREVGVEVVDVKGWHYKVPCRVLKTSEREEK